MSAIDERTGRVKLYNSKQEREVVEQYAGLPLLLPAKICKTALGNGTYHGNARAAPAFVLWPRSRGRSLKNRYSGTGRCYVSRKHDCCSQTCSPS